MISAKEARDITDNKELREIEAMIVKACNEGGNFITKEGYIHSEVERKLIELGFEVSYTNENFYHGSETMISW